MKKQTLTTVAALTGGLTLGAALTMWADADVAAQTSREERFQTEQYARVFFIRDTYTGACYVALNEGGITKADCGRTPTPTR